MKIFVAPLQWKQQQQLRAAVKIVAYFRAELKFNFQLAYFNLIAFRGHKRLLRLFVTTR